MYDINSSIRDHCSGPIILLACRLQREEAKITAWENLQKAKAEAAIRKLEVDSFSALYFIHQFNYILLLETAEMLRYLKEFIFKLTLSSFSKFFSRTNREFNKFCFEKCTILSSLVLLRSCYYVSYAN